MSHYYCNSSGAFTCLILLQHALVNSFIQLFSPAALISNFCMVPLYFTSLLKAAVYSIQCLLPVLPVCRLPLCLQHKRLQVTARSPAFVPLLDYFPRRPYLLLSPVPLLRSSLSLFLLLTSLFSLKVEPGISQSLAGKLPSLFKFWSSPSQSVQTQLAALLATFWTWQAGGLSGWQFSHKTHVHTGGSHPNSCSRQGKQQEVCPDLVCTPCLGMRWAMPQKYLFLA